MPSLISVITFARAVPDISSGEKKDGVVLRVEAGDTFINLLGGVFT